MKGKVIALVALAGLLSGCRSAGQPAEPQELYNRLLNVRALVFSPDSRVLVGGRSLGSGESQADLLIWEGGSMKEVHAHPDSVVGLTFLHAQMVSAGADGTLKLWTPGHTEADKTLTSTHWYAAMSPTGALLHGPGRGTFQPRQAEIEVWDLEKGEKTRTFPTPGALSLSGSQDGTWLATAHSEPVVRLWHSDGSAAGEIATAATAVCLSPDGKWLATGGADGSLQIWECASARLQQSLPGLGQRVTALAYSADGTRLAAGCEGKLALYAEGKPLWQKAIDSYASPSVLAFSPDGKKLASAGPSKVLLWQL